MEGFADLAGGAFSRFCTRTRKEHEVKGTSTSFPSLSSNGSHSFCRSLTCSSISNTALEVYECIDERATRGFCRWAMQARDCIFPSQIHKKSIPNQDALLRRVHCAVPLCKSSPNHLLCLDMPEDQLAMTPPCCKRFSVHMLACLSSHLPPSLSCTAAGALFVSRGMSLGSAMFLRTEL